MNISLTLRKFEDVKMGKTVITNALELDTLIDYVSEHPEVDPEDFMNHLKSLPNPNRVGILDQYIAFIGYDVPEKI